MRVHLSVASALDLSLRYEQKTEMKPRGLWYGVEWAWLEWCSRNVNEWCRPEVRAFEIELDESRLLRLRSPGEVLEFHSRWASCPFPGYPVSWPEWSRIAGEHAGVEFSPYGLGFGLNYDLSWYWSIDCDSGCVWDLSIIKSVKEVRRPF